MKFDFEFTSGAGADGILSFYLDLNAANSAAVQRSTGFFDHFERFAVDPLKNGTKQQSGEIFFPSPLTAGDHVLAVRLDDGAAAASKIDIFDLRLGSTMTVLPEPSTCVMTVLGALAATAYLRRKRGTR